jgi:alanine racemase
MDMLKKLGVSPQFVHIANSSGILNSKKLTRLGNTARAGIALYGIDPMFHNNKLKPVLSFKTKIAQIKEIKKGEFVGYNFTFKAKNDMRLAILPAGYNDGIDRKLSNKGIVKVRGVVCPIVGVVSMNITTIDISKVVKAKEEEEVLVYSSKREDNNSIANVVKLTNTLPYELLVHLNETTKRIVV